MSTADNSTATLKAAILRGVFAQNVTLLQPPGAPRQQALAAVLPLITPPEPWHVSARRVLRRVLVSGIWLLWWLPMPTVVLPISETTIRALTPLALWSTANPPLVSADPAPANPISSDALLTPAPLALPLQTSAAASPPQLEALTASAPIPLATLFGLQFRTIVIDPGHGGHDPGAVSASGMSEKYLTLDIALRLEQRLQRAGYRVLLTRRTDRRFTLKQRVAFVRSANADVFISLHFNTLPQKYANVVETYYFGTEVTVQTAATAAKENHGSDVTFAEFKQLLRTINYTLKTQESRDLAAQLQTALFGELETQDARLTDAGIKTAPFMVLLGIDIPGVLVEISCLSHPAEARRLATSAHRDRIAAALERGIVAYLENQSLTQSVVTGERAHVESKTD